MAWTPPSDAVETQAFPTPVVNTGWTPPSDAVETQAFPTPVVNTGWTPPSDAVEVSGAPVATRAPPVSVVKPAPEPQESLGSPMGDDFSSAIMAVAQPKKKSVLEGVEIPEPTYNPAELTRLSQRKYAEEQAQKFDPRYQQSMTQGGPRKPPSAAELSGGMMQNANPFARIGKKALQVGAEGVGGVLRAAGDVVGSDTLAGTGEYMGKNAREYQQAMGPAITGDIQGFGPKSVVPDVLKYTAEMGEGAASSLAQSIAASALGPAAVLPSLSAVSGFSQYNKARDAGQSVLDASINAALYAGTEYAGGKFVGLDKAASALKNLVNQGASTEAKKQAGNTLFKMGVREIPGELATYLGQTGVDLLPGIGLNPNLTMAEFLDGLRDTVVQAGMMGGASAGVGKYLQGTTPQKTQSAEQIARERGFLVSEPKAKPPVAPIAPTSERIEPTFEPEKFKAQPPVTDKRQALKDALADKIRALAGPSAEETNAPIQKGAKDVTEPISKTGGEGVAIPAQPADNVPPAEGVGGVERDGVVPTGQDVTEPAVGEGAQPAAVEGKAEQTQFPGRITVEVPIDQLQLSEDVPQFKTDANKEGVVEPLGGKFERTGVAPIQVWRRNDGRMEIISGRHRFDLAKRSGEKTIPAQIHDEAAGFTKDMAAVLDAELNIRDGQGKVKDYVNYFKGTGLDQDTAESRGLLARSTGKRAFTISNQGSDELIAGVRSDKVGDEAAYLIALNAPNDSRLQSVGIKAIQEGKSASAAVNLMQAVKALAQESDTTTDMFGFDESAMKEAEEMAKIAASKQREMQTRLSAITGAAKNPALAKAEGIDIRDPEAIKRRIDELRQLKASWDNWSTNPDLIAEIRAARGTPIPKAEPINLESPTEEDIADQEERKANAEKLDEQEQIRKESEAGADQFELTTEEGRQDTTGNLFDQPAAEEPETVAISPEQERKEALEQFEKQLSVPIPPFYAKSANKTQLLKPAPLTSAQIKEVMRLASDALDLGMPAAVLGNITAAGSTRMKAAAVMSAQGELMTGSQWKTASTAEKLQSLIHELGHSIDFTSGKISDKADWSKAHTQLQNWYTGSANKFMHPLAYPFSPRFQGKVYSKMESFAQAFGYYFTSPVDLQKNAPEAYSQIQAIVERIQDGSQTARAAGTTERGTSGIQVQPSRVEKDTTVQPNASRVGTAVSAIEGLEDRGAASVTNTPEFKRWFGGSKVVDENGDPAPVYRGYQTGTGNNKFTFYSDNPQVAEGYANKYDNFAYELRTGADVYRFDSFAEAKAAKIGNGGKIVKVNNAPTMQKDFLSLKNPLVVDAKGAAWNMLKNPFAKLSDVKSYEKEMAGATKPKYINGPYSVERQKADITRSYYFSVFSDTNQLAELAQSNGYDGLIIKNVVDIAKPIEGDARSTVLVAFDPKQIKSATSSIGTYDLEVSDINASILPEEKEKKALLFGRDRLGRVNFGSGAVAHRTVADIANKVLDKISMKPISPELSRAIKNMKAKVELTKNKVAEVASDMSNLSPEEREMISDVIEGELKAGVYPPQHILDIAAAIQSMMSRQSKELVDLGMLSEEAANRWENKYLPRFYERQLKDSVNAWSKAAKEVFMKQPMMRGIRGSNLRNRGLYKPISVDDLPNWLSEGWEQRDPKFDPKKSVETIVWRDYTREERENMGEIRDAMFRFVMGYNASQRDIALGGLYKSLAKDYASRFPLDGYVQVPTGNAEGTGAARYGALEGMYVPKEIMDHLSADDHAMAEGVLKIYRAGLSKWKEGKTVLNPVAHGNNVMSNLTMAHFAGVSYWDAHKYAGAIKDLAKNDNEMVQEAKEVGLFGGTFSQAELIKSMPPELRAMANLTESALSRFGERIWDTLAFTVEVGGKKYGARPVMQWAYENEDLFFRYLIYRDARSRGMNPEDARDYSQEFIFTYDDLPKGARLLRDLALPFFGYTYKIVPVLARTALEYPWRFAAPATVAYAANAMMYAIAANLGGDDDDWWGKVLYKYITDEEFRKKAKNLEANERRNLPEWMKGDSLILQTPKAIRMGMDEVTKLPLFLDIGHIFPGGDLLDANNNSGGVALIQPLVPGNPVLTSLVAMYGNRDLFFGKDVTKKTETDTEQEVKRGQWLWRQFTPAISVGNYHFDRAMSTISNMTGKPITLDAGPFGVIDYTGTGKDKLPVQLKYSALQTVGIKVRPYDLEMGEVFDKNKKRALIRDLNFEIKKIDRQESGNIKSPEAAEIERQKLREKRSNIKQGLILSGEEKK
jgi:hypothetical protein